MQVNLLCLQQVSGALAGGGICMQVNLLCLQQVSGALAGGGICMQVNLLCFQHVSGALAGGGICMQIPWHCLQQVSETLALRGDFHANDLPLFSAGGSAGGGSACRSTFFVCSRSQKPWQEVGDLHAKSPGIVCSRPQKPWQEGGICMQITWHCLKQV